MSKSFIVGSIIMTVFICVNMVYVERVNSDQKEDIVDEKVQNDLNSFNPFNSDYKFSEEKKTELNKMINEASNGQAVVVHYFETPYTLTGVVLEGALPNGDYMLGWVSEVDDLVILGQAFNKEGEELTSTAMRKLQELDLIKENNQEEDVQNKVSELTNKDKSEMLFGTAHLEHYKELKNPVQELYVFFNLTCPYCKRLYEAIDNTDIFLENNIQVKWVPTANSKILHASAYLIESDDLSNLKKISDERRFDKYNVDNEELLEQINYNGYVAGEIAERRAVPMLAWVDVNTEEVVSQVGAPPAEHFGTLVEYLLGEKSE